MRHGELTLLGTVLALLLAGPAAAAPQEQEQEQEPKLLGYCESVGLHCEFCARENPELAAKVGRARDHAAWLKRRHPSGDGESSHRLEFVREKLSGSLFVASTRNFVLISDQNEMKLESRSGKHLKPKLREVELLLPGVVDSNKVVTAHEWLHLHLVRMQKTFEYFCDYLAIPEDERRFAEGKTEVFMLGPQNAEIFKSLQHGTGQFRGDTTRFAITPPQNIGEHYPGHKMPRDQYRIARIAAQVARSLIGKYQRAKATTRGRLFEPSFLYSGIASHFERRVSDGEIPERRYEGTEFPDVKDSYKSNWPAWIRQLVNSKSRHYKRPQISRLLRLDLSGRNDGGADRVAAWSLVHFLHQEDVDSFRELVVRLATERPDEALYGIYKATEPHLAKKWFDWVKRNRGRPAKALQRKEPMSAVAASDIRDDFDGLWKKQEKKRPYERYSTVSSLRYLEPAERFDLILRVLECSDDACIHLAVRILRSAPEAEVGKLLVDALARAREEEDEVVLTHLLRAAGAFSKCSGDLCPIIVETIAHEDASELVRAEGVHALGQLGDRSAIEAVRTAGSDEHPYVRAEAAIALARLASGEGRDLAAKLIDDDSWNVRAASIRLFRGFDPAWSIPRLIERFFVETGRMNEDIHDALVALSPVDRGMDALSWRTWWEKEGKKALAGKARKEREYDRAGEGIYGEIYSKRFIFLIDVSTSMKTEIHNVGEYSQTVSKIEYVRDQTQKVLLGELPLRKDVMFNIRLFSGNEKTNAWKSRGLVKATKASCSKASAWLGDQIPEDERATDLNTALAEIFDAADMAHESGQEGSEWDTVYLVSDGFMTEGHIDRAEILSLVRERNRLHRIRINTITLGALDTDPEFMKKLAEQNFGTSRRIR